MSPKKPKKPVTITEGKFSKGGQNPPLEVGFKRPPPPKGSGGAKYKY